MPDDSELTKSSNMLSASVERYYTACMEIQRSYARGEKLHTQLPLRMDAQLENSALVELKLRKATAALRWSRNLSTTRCTINSLPSELLTYIFCLVHRIHPCAKRDYDVGDLKTEPIYPAVLSVVCSRWRDIAFSTPSLWPHIDISTSALLNRQRLSGLMLLHERQAGQLPLSLHIFDCPGYDKSSIHPRTTWDLVGQLAGRATSFDFDVKADYDYDIHDNILSTFFKNCTPGKLVRLTLMMDDDEPRVVNGNNDPEADLQDIRMDLPIEQLEDTLAHISALHLCSLHFSWNSRAYHGLVELRLTGFRVRIPESELTSILWSSPDLQILEFDIIIRDALPDDNQITPIPLNNLQVLNLMKMNPDEIHLLLRWLAPGSKPLHFALSMFHWKSLDRMLKEKNSMSFFSRTYVTKLYVKKLEFSHIIELLQLLPSLQMLALEQVILRSTEDKPITWDIVKFTPARQLERLYIIGCVVEMSIIHSWLNCPTLSIQNVVFYDCTLFLDDYQIPDHEEASRMEELTQNHPEIVFVTSIQDAQGPNLAKTWELFPTYC